MYPMTLVKKRTSSRLQTTTLGAPPPLILGFHPSKRHAALIATRDQGSIVLVFTLVLLILKAFLMASSTSYLSVRSTALIDLSCFCCLLSTNIILSLRDHVIILY